MTFRQFLINNYWGKGYSKIPGIKFTSEFPFVKFQMIWSSYYKGGPRNFLTLLTMGIIRIILDKTGIESGDTIMIILSILFTGWVLFTGFEFPFKYWQKNPVRWEEIQGDMLKKWIYGQQHFIAQGKYYPMTYEQLREWSDIDKFYKYKFRT